MTTVPHLDAITSDASTLADEAYGLEPLPPPRAVGPYVLLERLGEGGMGVVYRAHDPRLAREVAIKLLRADLGRPGAQSRARLVREARAMAHIAHPNVVQVFDVGTVGSQVFVAMELVEGGTLTRWLRERPRSTQEILDVFAEAGRGLHAAHDKGLVHRDFKPDNVLVGKDGRVRVTDFGLARAIEDDPASARREDEAEPPWSEPAEAEPAEAEPAEAEAEGSDAAFRLVTKDDGLGALTRTGVVMGTPAYMALEQHMGGISDARTDQFAFCVALFEALAGHRPFVGITDLELGRAKRDMALTELPPRAGLRPALRRALVRGMQADPAQRWPSMTPLLAVLSPPRRVSRWAGLGIGLVGVLAVGLWAARPDGEIDRCEGAEARAMRAWSESRQAAISQAFAATGVDYAEDSWQRVHARVDDHLAQWRAAHAEACAPATREAAGDGRMDCLDRTLARLEGLVLTLEEADGAMVEHAVGLAYSMRSPAECLDPVQAERGQPSAPTPALAAAWTRHADTMPHVELLLQIGRGRRALELARTLVQEAEASDWPPLRAQALLALGGTLEAVDDFNGAEQALAESYSLANEHELDGLAAQAAAQMVWVAGPRRLDEAEAQRWARHARTSIERQAGGDLSTEAHLENALGSMYLSLGQPGPAELAYRRALQLYREQHGDDHPHVAVARSNLGAALASSGDYIGSLEHQRAAVEIWIGTLGEHHPAMADAIDNTALAYARLGRYDEAVTAQQRALELRRNTFDADDLSIATSLNNLGAYEEALGRYEQAEAHHRQAMARHEAALGPDDIRVAASRVNLGSVVLRLGRHAEARTLAERAISVLERTAPEHPYLGSALVLLGSAAERGGDVDAAESAIERALTLCDGAVALEPLVCTEARYVLARALGAKPEGRERALALARRAQLELRAAPEAAALEREVDEWLRALEATPEH
jgi:tetratricopeptide (TPR) repeat protein